MHDVAVEVLVALGRVEGHQADARRGSSNAAAVCARCGRRAGGRRATSAALPRSEAQLRCRTCAASASRSPRVAPASAGDCRQRDRGTLIDGDPPAPVRGEAVEHEPALGVGLARSGVEQLTDERAGLSREATREGQREDELDVGARILRRDRQVRGRVGEAPETQIAHAEQRAHGSVLIGGRRLGSRTHEELRGCDGESASQRVCCGRDEIVDVLRLAGRRRAQEVAGAPLGRRARGAQDAGGAKVCKRQVVRTGVRNHGLGQRRMRELDRGARREDADRLELARRAEDLLDFEVRQGRGVTKLGIVAEHSHGLGDGARRGRCPARRPRTTAVRACADQASPGRGAPRAAAAAACSIQNGVPPVARCTASTVAAATSARRRSSIALTPSALRPRSGILTACAWMASNAASSAEGSASRTPSTSANASASMRCATNASARSDGPSAQCASSTSMTVGRVRVEPVGDPVDRVQQGRRCVDGSSGDASSPSATAAG